MKDLVTFRRYHNGRLQRSVLLARSQAIAWIDRTEQRELLIGNTTKRISDVELLVVKIGGNKIRFVCEQNEIV